MRFRFVRRAVLGCVLGAAAAVLPGCSTDRDAGDLLAPEDIDVLVLDAVLVVGEPLPPVRLTRTGNPSEPYDSERVIVDDVERMEITIETATEDRLVPYRYGEHGFYFPTEERIVEPNARYAIEIVTPAEEVVRAHTITPARLEIPDWVILDPSGTNVIRRLAPFTDPGQADPDSVFFENEVVYQTGLLEARFDRPDVPGFQVGIYSLDPGSDFVIDPDFFEEEDFEDLERIGSSPPLLAEDGTLRLPWFAIFFEGRYLVKIFAMDRNWYDLARSTPDLASGGPGFGGQAGDDFERPIFHIEGGIGLFGSASVDSLGFYVLPRP